jgi:hypothetical protein
MQPGEWLERQVAELAALAAVYGEAGEASCGRREGLLLEPVERAALEQAEEVGGPGALL